MTCNEKEFGFSSVAPRSPGLQRFFASQVARLGLSNYADNREAF